MGEITPTTLKAILLICYEIFHLVNNIKKKKNNSVYCKNLLNFRFTIIPASTVSPDFRLPFSSHGVCVKQQ